MAASDSRRTAGGAELTGSMRLRTYCVETWGCQMNVLDSQHLEGLLQSLGLEAAPTAERADVVLLNTCSVRDKAVQKVLTRLGQLRQAQEAGGLPRVVGLCGCVAEQEGADLLTRSKAVTFVLGPGRIASLPDAIRAASLGRRQSVTGFAPSRDLDFQTVVRNGGNRHFVTVVHGCSQHCTFCVVPYTRGHEVSRPLRDVVAEVRHLALRWPGSELTLLGQTVNAYRCPESGADFADLLTAVGEIDGLWRLQFLTSHPKFFTDKMIDALASIRHVGSYVHVPLQSGSTAILRRMRRGYTREEYLELVRRLWSALPNVTLSTDIIVAFPGETDEDFEATLSAVEEVRFGQLYGFIYSPRPRTPAARYGERVPRALARQRIERLFAVQSEIQLALNQRLVGREVEILVDGPAKRGAGLWQGRGDDNRVVNFPAWKGITVGSLARIVITGATAHALVGHRAPSVVDRG